MASSNPKEWGWAVEESGSGADSAPAAASKPLTAQPEVAAVLKTKAERSPRSPYTKGPITINVGMTPITYYVPWHLLKSTSWSDVPAGGEINLPTLDKDAGHILVHYLYTGDYQPLESKTCGIAQQSRFALKQALLVYRTSVTHALGGLEHLARHQIKENSASMDPKTILDITWSELSRKSEPSGWLQEYLEEMTQQAFEKDHTVFADDAFCASLRNKSKLNDFVMRHVIKLLSEKLTQALEGQGSIAGNFDSLEPPQPVVQGIIAEKVQNDDLNEDPSDHVENNMEEIKEDGDFEGKGDEAAVIAKCCSVDDDPFSVSDIKLAGIEQPEEFAKTLSPTSGPDESWEAPPPANNRWNSWAPVDDTWETSARAQDSWEAPAPAHDIAETPAPDHNSWDTPAPAPADRPIATKKKNKRFGRKKVVAESTKVY